MALTSASDGGLKQLYIEDWDRSIWGCRCSTGHASLSFISPGEGPENLEVEGRMRGSPIAPERLEPEEIVLSVADAAEKDGKAVRSSN